MLLPPYVYDLIAAVQRYEDEHPKGAGQCFEDALCRIPKEELDRAAAIAHYQRETAELADSAERDARTARELSGGYPLADLAVPVPWPSREDDDAEVRPRSTRCRCSLTAVIAPESLRVAVARAIQDAIAYNLRWGLQAVSAFRFNPVDYAALLLDEGDTVTWMGALTRIEVDGSVPAGLFRVVNTAGGWREIELPTLPKEA